MPRTVPSKGVGGESLTHARTELHQGAIAPAERARLCAAHLEARAPRVGSLRVSVTAAATDTYSDFARSRSTNFWIFPVDVFGSGPNTTVRGVL